MGTSPYRWTLVSKPYSNLHNHSPISTALFLPMLSCLNASRSLKSLSVPGLSRFCQIIPQIRMKAQTYMQRPVSQGCLCTQVTAQHFQGVCPNGFSWSHRTVGFDFLNSRSSLIFITPEASFWFDSNLEFSSQNTPNPEAFNFSDCYYSSQAQCRLSPTFPEKSQQLLRPTEKKNKKREGQLLDSLFPPVAKIAYKHISGDLGNLSIITSAYEASQS